MQPRHFWGALALLALCAGAAPPARASSHAEAPLIAEDPVADNTDVYMFRSPENPSRLVILANYIPMEEPSGGPTYTYFSERVLYEIHVDRNNDGREDLTFQFRFRTQVQTPGTLLPYLGPITQLTGGSGAVVSGSNPVNPLYNRFQTYSVNLVTHRRRGRDLTQLLAQNVIVPPNNAGSTTIPNYGQLVQQAIHTINPQGIRTFAGQVDDPFFLDLGAIFDLLRVRPFRQLHVLNGATPLPNRAVAPDLLSGFNCHTLALEIPITLLTQTAQVPGPADPNRILGVYASASRRRISVLRTGGGAQDAGPWVQVSRLGAPLVNELFLPLADPRGRTRDFWNSTEPENDAQFRDFFRFPEVSLRLAQLYPILRPVIPNLNANATGFAGPRTEFLGSATPLLNFAPDFLRVDVSTAPTGTPNRLGVIGGDAQGFPNGRRLADDVVDIFMRAAAGVLVPGQITIPELGFTGTRAQALAAVNFGDGVDANDNGRVGFRGTFPFVANAHNGVNPAHVGHEDPEAGGQP